MFTHACSEKQSGSQVLTRFRRLVFTRYCDLGQCWNNSVVVGNNIHGVAGLEEKDKSGSLQWFYYMGCCNWWVVILYIYGNILVTNILYRGALSWYVHVHVATAGVAVTKALFIAWCHYWCHVRVHVHCSATNMISCCADSFVYAVLWKSSDVAS